MSEYNRENSPKGWRGTLGSEDVEYESPQYHQEANATPKGWRRTLGSEDDYGLPNQFNSNEVTQHSSGIDRCVHKGPLGTVFKVIYNEREAFRWELPKCLCNPADVKALNFAAGKAIDLRGAIRKLIKYSDDNGIVWLADDAGTRDELSLAEWFQSLSEKVPPEWAFVFVRTIAQILDVAADNGCVPQRFVPSTVFMHPIDASNEPDFFLNEFCITDVVRAALEKRGMPTDAEQEDNIWQAPEVRNGGYAIATPSSNQWTLARMACRMLSGKDSSDGSPLIPKWLDAGQKDALRRALSDNPKQRFSRCSEFATMLETGKMPQSPGNPARKNAIFAALLLVAGVIAAVWGIERVRNERVNVEIKPTGEVESLPENVLSESAAKILDQALAAKKDGRWKECLSAAEKVLAEASWHEQANALVVEAKEELRPWLRIEADKPGAWIVRKGEKIKLPTRIRLEPGKKEGPWDVQAVVDGVTWSGFIPEFIVDSEWTGIRNREVVLSRGMAGSGIDKKRRTITLPDGKTFTMIWCPPGTFVIGMRGSGDERTVRLTKGFWLAEKEFTVGEWKSLDIRSPSSIAKLNNEFKKQVLNDVNKRPLENVSWEECNAFISKLNDSGCDLDLVFRLPTEAEWEYACRAGTDGDFAGNLDDLSWYSENAKNIHVVDKNTNVVVYESLIPSQPGEKKPNGWGFYDMHGNVSEWCADVWGANWWRHHQKDIPLYDPIGPRSGKQHVVRGGNVTSSKNDCASHSREFAPKLENRTDKILATFQKNDKQYVNIGFRLAADEVK